MRRFLFNLAALASSIAFAAMLALAVRGRSVTDTFTAERFRGYQFISSNGSFFLIVKHETLSVGGRTPIPYRLSDEWAFHHEATHEPTLTWNTLGIDDQRAAFDARADVPCGSLRSGGFTFDEFASFMKCPAWLPPVLTALLPAVWVIRRFRRQSRRQLGLCPRCGYDLRATSGRCPECGRIDSQAATALS